MRVSLAKDETPEFAKLDKDVVHFVICPDTLFDENWILTRIGSTGTKKQAEIRVDKIQGRISIDIKTPVASE